MNKSIGNTYRNNKSISGLNNIEAFDITVSGTLATTNFSDIDATLTSLSTDVSTLQSEQIDLTSFSGDILPEEDDTQDVGSTSKRIQYIHATQVVCSQILGTTLANSIGINAVGLITFYNNVIPSGTRSIGLSGATFNTAYIDEIYTSNHSVDAKLTSLSTSINLNQSNINSNTLSISSLNNDFLILNSSVSQNSTDINDLQIITGDMAVNAGNFEIDVGNGNSIEFLVNTSNQLLIDNTGLILGNDITCNTDSSYDIGSSSYRFNDAYFKNLDLFQTLTTRNYTDDTTIDSGNIATSTSCDRFRKQIVFDTGLRTMYIGQLYQSTLTSNALFAIGLDGGGSPDPNIGFVMNNGGDCQIKGNFRSNNIYPSVDDTYDLGSSSLRWNDIYATNSVIQTSDERNKYYIQTLEQQKMVDFVKNLNPVRFKWKSEKEKKGNRFHFGMLAQQVEKALPYDAGVFIHNEENDSFGIRYNEMIAPLVSVIQQLIKRIEILESKET